MKRQKKHLGVGGAFFMTIAFAVMAIYSFNSAPHDGEWVAWIPTIGAIVGVVMTIIAVNKDSNEDFRKNQQASFEKTVVHDSSFGNVDLKMYFDSTSRKVTVCATSKSGTTQKVVDDFVKTDVVETDTYLVAIDLENNKVLRARNDNGSVLLTEYSINDQLKELDITFKPSAITLKPFNDYAFITDDKNEFVAIITPENIHVLRYSDIVSITYEENGSDIFNKSIGDAVAGGLLFGGVGAIVGSNTAKTTQNKIIKKMSIKILLKSTSEPTIVLKIFEAGRDGAILSTEETEDKVHYEGLMKEVHGIQDIFSIIIDIVDRKIVQQSPSSMISSQSAISVADELTKLAKLKAEGILSEEEFNAQKAKILS